MIEFQFDFFQLEIVNKVFWFYQPIHRKNLFIKTIFKFIIRSWKPSKFKKWIKSISGEENANILRDLNLMQKSIAKINAASEIMQSVQRPWILVLNVDWMVQTLNISKIMLKIAFVLSNLSMNVMYVIWNLQSSRKWEIVKGQNITGNANYALEESRTFS